LLASVKISLLLGRRMSDLDKFNYECEGQLSLFGSSEFSQEESAPECKLVNDCEAYPQGCGGTIEPCRFGGPYKWSEVHHD
jgi:hypothetical protein